MSTTLPVIKVSDLPDPYAEIAYGVGIVQTAEQSPSQSGEYQRIHLAVLYQDGDQQKTAHIRFNLKPVWLTPEYVNRAKLRQLDPKEQLQYDINVLRLWRGLFKAADLTDMALDLLPGKRIGFVIDYRYDRETGEPKSDAPEIQRFFHPSQADRVLAGIKHRAQQRESLRAGRPNGIATLDPAEEVPF